jgi:hypothetical protein
MTRLTDTQAILLSSASRRDDGNLLPLPESLGEGATAKALTALRKRNLIEEREVCDESAAHRIDGDLRYGLFLTAAGGSAIGIEPSDAPAPDQGTGTPLAAAALSMSKPPTKSATVLALLGRTDGATLSELIEATGWLPHTTRAALTGFRKKGHEIARTKREGATCYCIVEQA